MIELFKNRKAELYLIAESYYQRLTTKKGKQQKVLPDYLDDEINAQTGTTKDFFEFYKAHLKEIVLASPPDFDKWIKEIEAINGDKKIIKEFFTDDKKGYYADYDRWGAYELAKKLKVDVCPYCNRNYTFTFGEDQQGQKGTRPDYDHFLDKATYPYLALSFYNLVPSCNICNSDFKGKKEFKLSKNIHPYLEGFESHAVFTSKPQTYEALLGIDEENLTIQVNITTKDKDLRTKIENNVEVFKINELYEQHGSIVSELYRKKHISNDKYLEILQQTFNGLGLSKEEMYRLAFGNFMNEKDFEKRPLSKLTHDIAQELGLL